MFAKTNDNITMLPIDSMEKFENAIRDGLKTEPLKVSIADSNLLGIYVAINSNGVIVPNVVKDHEILEIKKTGLNVYRSNETNNAHGNNMAVNDHGGIINPEVGIAERKAIGETLGIEMVPMRIGNYSTLGSACIASNSGFLVHYKTTDDEMTGVEDALKVSGNRGTINTGTGFVAYGALVNKNGYLVGEDTTAFEMGRLEEALGMIK